MSEFLQFITPVALGGVYLWAVFWHKGTPEKSKVEQLADYQFPEVVRYVFRREHPGYDQADEDLAFKGLCEFFLLLFLEKEANRSLQLGMPSALIDDAWHAFIVCTHDYEKFCKHFYGRLIHHFPDVGALPHSMEDARVFKPDVMNTWKALKQNYKKWPGLFEPFNGLPLLFAADSSSSVSPGWIWSEESLKRLDTATLTPHKKGGSTVNEFTDGAAAVAGVVAVDGCGSAGTSCSAGGSGCGGGSCGSGCGGGGSGCGGC
ncbi:uncharacterized protein NMK_2100 [Novimethylophilus kurashikiensis]|uniref:Uncharacterized protein n=1 Tax=Novimethylophilus kurashikiensis TaxID=1825523 RepID=A0A2R5FCR1_9PROT|nr:hypothetical protein [Novimethylophilus kurashikiensis]GBG14501.1 uncharacterized protein NMK_2100 [Novimethylophilus kurashikiensis]